MFGFIGNLNVHGHHNVNQWKLDLSVLISLYDSWGHYCPASVVLSHGLALLTQEATCASMLLFMMFVTIEQPHVHVYNLFVLTTDCIGTILFMRKWL